MDTQERKESKRGKRDCLCLAIEGRKKNRNENMMYNFTTREWWFLLLPSGLLLIIIPLLHSDSSFQSCFFESVQYKGGGRACCR